MGGCYEQPVDDRSSDLIKYVWFDHNWYGARAPSIGGGVGCNCTGWASSDEESLLKQDEVTGRIIALMKSQNISRRVVVSLTYT